MHSKHFLKAMVKLSLFTVIWEVKDNRLQSVVDALQIKNQIHLN